MPAPSRSLQSARLPGLLPRLPRAVALGLGALVMGVAAARQEGGPWRPLGPPVTTGPATDPRVAVDPRGQVWVAYEDCTAVGSCGRLTIARYDAVADVWVPVGGRFAASAGRSFFHTLGFDGQGGAFVASLDYGAPTLSHGPRGLNVRGFDRASDAWWTLGGPALSEGEVHCTDLAVTPTGDVVVAFKDGLARLIDGERVVQGHLGRASVLRFHRDAQGVWRSRYLGPPGFSGGRETWHHNVEVDPSGAIWTAWRDESFGRRAVVARYDELRDAWDLAGPPGFTIGDAGNMRLGLDRLGRPHVVHFTSSHLVVQRLERRATLATSEWLTLHAPVAVGEQPHFQYREWVPLEFDLQNRAWTAYHADAPAFGGRVVVRCYDEASDRWLAVGALDATGQVVGPSPGAADAVTLALGPDGAPYVAFRDLSAGGPGPAPLVVMTR